jgi:dTDP-glucose pyrophosphorylase
MNASRLGIVLVTGTDRRLLGTITDGDLRRAMLARMELEQPVAALLARKAGTAYAKPITAPAGADRATYLELFQRHRILHLPLVDARSRVTGLVTLEELLPAAPSIGAVVMAGGQGRRLTPLTEEVPKPMLPVGDRPIMELIIERLRQAGITQVSVTTHHKSEKITEHFGDGSEFGVQMTYVSEDQPLGTAGGLGLLAPLQETTLVVNGDILTGVDFRLMLAFHREHQADLTVAVRHYEVKVPFGVVECDGPVVTGLSEKPAMGFFVNAGMYLMEPSAHRFIPRGQRFDMTDLIQRLLREGRPVISFPVLETWLDIGEHAEYVRAQELVKQGSAKL